VTNRARSASQSYADVIPARHEAHPLPTGQDPPFHPLRACPQPSGCTIGIPVSTTHTIAGAIVGVGAARKTAAVRWNVASDVILAWIVTLPAAALFGSAFYELYKLLS